MNTENSKLQFDIHIFSNTKNIDVMNSQVSRLEKLNFFNTSYNIHVPRLYVTDTFNTDDLNNLNPKNEYDLIIIMMNNFDKEALYKAINKGVKGAFEINTPDEELQKGIIEVIKHHGIAIKNLDFYQRLVEMFPDMLHSVDTSGKIIWCNKRASDILGYTKDELIGMNIFNIYSPKIKEALSDGFNKLQKEGELVVNESLVRSKKGEDIDVEVRSFSQYDYLGNFCNTASILRDIREKINFEKQKIQTTKMAALGELSSSLAHDMSNPILSLQLFTELFEEQIDKPELMEHVKNMKATVNMLSKLVQHMKDYARESFKKQKDPVSVIVALDNAFILLTKKIRTNNVNIINEYKNNNLMIMGDIIQLEQVFMNLLSNACDALTGKKDGIIKIKTYTEIKDNIDFAVIEISDNGSGIPQELHEKIFSTFFTTKEAGKGTGLGLSSAVSIIKSHNGTLCIKKSDSNGTTFKISIPLFH